MTEYRKLYNQAKSIIAHKYNVELHEEMVKLGYTKKEKIMKVADKKEVVKNADKFVGHLEKDGKKVEIKK
jgi:hypothetical protein